MDTNDKKLDFSRRLIKGKIAEIIFSQMFCEAGKFTVIPFGYENTFPEIAQYAHMAEYKKVLENISTAPDFALVSQDKKEVFLVEVKYRHNPSEEQLAEEAEKILAKWNVVWLFVATTQGFFFTPCSEIVKEKGKMRSLTTSWINEDLQRKYLTLLTEFEE